MSPFYSLARKVTLDGFEIVHLLLSAFLQWSRSFVRQATQAGLSQSSQPGRLRPDTYDRPAHLTFMLLPLAR